MHINQPIFRYCPSAAADTISVYPQVVFDNCFNLVTKLWVGRSDVRQQQHIFLFRQTSTNALGPTQPRVEVTVLISPETSNRSVRLSTYLPLEPELRTNVALPLPHQCDFRASQRQLFLFLELTQCHCIGAWQQAACWEGQGKD